MYNIKGIVALYNDGSISHIYGTYDEQDAKTIRKLGRGTVINSVGNMGFSYKAQGITIMLWM